MPRDANGLYSLPLPEVAAGTTITTVWGNTTTLDLASAMSDSLSRSGLGGMLAPLRLLDGTLVAPGLGFVTEVGLGMYRSAAGVFNFVANGNQMVRFSEANNMEVWRDEGGGAAWHPVSTSSQLALNFAKYLQGYELGGLHTGYAADLDDIAFNSLYSFDSGSVTNFPPDMDGTIGIVETNFWDQDTTQAVQVVTGMEQVNVGQSFVRIKETDVWGDWEPFSSGSAWMLTTPPPVAREGDRWWDPDVGRAFVYYVDSDSSQWVEEDPNGVETTKVIAVGMVSAFSADPGDISWLFCDGSAVSRSDNSILFARIGTMYGVGDGTTTFNLPDYRGTFLRGQDAGAGVDPDAGARTDRGDGVTGDNVGTKQVDEVGTHNHTSTQSDGGSVVPSNNGRAAAANNSNGGSRVIDEYVGSESRPVNTYVRWYIFAGLTLPVQDANKTFSAYGSISGTGVVTDDNGYFTAAALGGGTLEMTFINPQPDANYTVTANGTQNDPRMCSVIAKTATSFQVRVFSEAGAGVVTNIAVACIRSGIPFA